MRRKLIIAMLLCLIIALSFAVLSTPVFAASTTQTNEPIAVNTACELTIGYSHGEQLFGGENVRIWRVASVSEDYQYTAVEPFASLGLRLNGVTSQAEWKEITGTLSAFITANGGNTTASGKTNEAGTVHFDNLETGLYFVSSVRADNGEYICVFEPFMVSLPMLNEEIVWEYAVNSHPKAENYQPKYEDVEYKVVKLWKDEGHEVKRPSLVKIEIYKNDELVETVQLNSANNWMYAWNAKDDGSVWQVIEKDVPQDYTMSVQKNGWIFSVTNTTKEHHPHEDTGDRDNVLLWTVIALIAGAGMIAVGLNGKKRNDA